MEFKELPGFSEIIGELLSDDAYAALQGELRARPDKGALISGTGGARKIRAAAKGHGKRGGGRLVYYFQVADFIHFLAVYPKNEKADLSPKDRKNLLAIIQGIKEGSL